MFHVVAYQRLHPQCVLRTMPRRVLLPSEMQLHASGGPALRGIASVKSLPREAFDNLVDAAETLMGMQPVVVALDVGTAQHFEERGAPVVRYAPHSEKAADSPFASRHSATCEHSCVMGVSRSWLTTWTHAPSKFFCLQRLDSLPAVCSARERLGRQRNTRASSFTRNRRRRRVRMEEMETEVEAQRHRGSRARNEVLDTRASLSQAEQMVERLRQDAALAAASMPPLAHALVGKVADWHRQLDATKVRVVMAALVVIVEQRGCGAGLMSVNYQVLSGRELSKTFVVRHGRRREVLRCFLAR